MIVTVTMNTALDRILTVPNFQRGKRHRASDKLTLAGGKGVIVARALKRLGVPVVATGFVGGRNGRRILEELSEEAVLNDLVRIEDESRTSTAVIDPTSGEYTEIIEWGPLVHPEELDILREKIDYLSRGAEMVVFAGSLPRGVDESFYAEMVRDLGRRGVSTVLDTEGEPLRLAMRGEPDVVSPNELEAEELVGHEFNDVDDRAHAVAEITRLGAAEAVMTVPDGCYAHVLEDGALTPYRVRVEEQDVRSSIGSGDAFLAGYVASRYTGRSPVDCLRFGVACGAESTQHFGAGLIDPARVEKLFAEVEAERLDVGTAIG